MTLYSISDLGTTISDCFGTYITLWRPFPFAIVFSAVWIFLVYSIARKEVPVIVKVTAWLTFAFSILVGTLQDRLRMANICNRYDITPLFWWLVPMLFMFAVFALFYWGLTPTSTSRRRLLLLFSWAFLVFMASASATAIYAGYFRNL